MEEIGKMFEINRSVANSERRRRSTRKKYELKDGTKNGCECD